MCIVINNGDLIRTKYQIYLQSHKMVWCDIKVNIKRPKNGYAKQWL